MYAHLVSYLLPYIIIIYILANTQCRDSNEPKCEDNIDKFLISYCRKTISNQCDACPTSTPQPVVPVPCTSSEPGTQCILYSCIFFHGQSIYNFHYTDVTTVMAAITNNTKCTNTSTSDTSSRQAVSQLSTVILGVLIGLLLIILVVVTTGWVWTCWTMKKQSNRTKLCTQCQVSTTTIAVL